MFRSEGLNVAPEQLLITDGCQQAIDLLCKAFLRPGDAVALENPAYPGAIAILAGARVRALAVGVEPDATRTGHVGTRYRRARNGADAESREIYFASRRIFTIRRARRCRSPQRAAAAGNRRALSGAGDRRQRSTRGLRLRGNADAVAARRSIRAGNVIQIDSFSKIAFPGLARRLVHRPRKRDRAAAPGEAVDRPAHRSACRRRRWPNSCAADISTRHLAKMKKVYRSRLEAMEEALEKHMPEETVVDAPRRRHVPVADAAAGFRCGELLIHARERGVLFRAGAAISIRSIRSRIRCAWDSRPSTKSASRAGVANSCRLAEAARCASGSAAREANCRPAWRSYERRMHAKGRRDDAAEAQSGEPLLRLRRRESARHAAGVRAGRRGAAHPRRVSRSARNIRAARASFTAASSPRCSMK